MVLTVRIFALLLILSALLTTSCKNRLDLSSRDSLLKGTAADTVVIKEKAVLFFHPDTLQIQRIQAKNPELNYENQAHDCQVMINNARLVLRQNYREIKELDNKGARYLLCIRNDNSNICIDMNAPAELCAIYAFDPDNDPYPVDPKDAETAFKNYFHR